MSAMRSAASRLARYISSNVSSAPWRSRALPPSATTTRSTGSSSPRRSPCRTAPRNAARPRPSRRRRRPTRSRSVIARRCVGISSSWLDPQDGSRELDRQEQEIAGEQDDLITTVDQHAAMARGMAGRVPDLDPGDHLAVLLRPGPASPVRARGADPAVPARRTRTAPRPGTPSPPGAGRGGRWRSAARRRSHGPRPNGRGACGSARTVETSEGSTPASSYACSAVRPSPGAHGATGRFPPRPVSTMVTPTRRADDERLDMPLPVGVTGERPGEGPPLLGPVHVRAPAIRRPAAAVPIPGTGRRSRRRPSRNGPTWLMAASLCRRVVDIGRLVDVAERSPGRVERLPGRRVDHGGSERLLQRSEPVLARMPERVRSVARGADAHQQRQRAEPAAVLERDRFDTRAPPRRAASPSPPRSRARACLRRPAGRGRHRRARPAARPFQRSFALRRRPARSEPGRRAAPTGARRRAPGRPPPRG